MASIRDGFVRAIAASPTGRRTVSHAVIKRRAFLSIQYDPKLFDDFAGDLALELQGVVNISLVALSPDVSLGGCSDQSRVNANPVAGKQHGTFHHSVDLQFPNHLAHGWAGSPVTGAQSGRD